MEKNLRKKNPENQNPENLKELDNEEQEIREQLAGIDRELYGEPFTSRLRSFFCAASKKAFFITSVPFYWFIVFKHVVGWYNPGFFVFVVVSSVVLSSVGANWGVINAAMK